jgi:hypothetical protein
MPGASADQGKIPDRTVIRFLRQAPGAGFAVGDIDELAVHPAFQKPMVSDPVDGTVGHRFQALPFDANKVRKPMEANRRERRTRPPESSHGGNPVGARVENVFGKSDDVAGQAFTIVRLDAEG